MSAPEVFPSQVQLSKDTVAAAVRALTLTTNPCFDQLLWDPVRHVLSFRLPGPLGYVNLWLDGDLGGGWCCSERNGGPAADSEVLWEL